MELSAGEENLIKKSIPQKAGGKKQRKKSMVTANKMAVIHQNMSH